MILVDDHLLLQKFYVFSADRLPLSLATNLPGIVIIDIKNLLGVIHISVSYTHLTLPTIYSV